MRKFLVMMILTGVVIAGCTAPAPIPTTTPQPSPTPIPSATPVPPRGMEYVIADTDDYTDPAQLRALVDSLPADWQATDEASPRYKMTITSQSAMLQQCHYNEGAFTGTLYRGTVEVTVSVKDDLSGATVITPIRMETGYLFDPNCPFAQTFITLKGASQGSANDFVYPQVEDFSRMIIAAAVSLGLDLPMENLPDRIYGLNDIVFSPDSQVLAMGGEDGIVKIMDIHTGEMRRMLMGHASQITSLDFSSDGKRLASGSADMTVRIWNLDTGEAEHVFTLTPGAEYPAVQLGFSPDDRLIGASSSLSELALWDIASEQSIIKQQSSAQIMEFLGFSSDSRAMIWTETSTQENAAGIGDETYSTTINFSDTATGELIRSIAKDYGLLSGVISPGKEYFLAEKDFCDLTLIALDTGKELYTKVFSGGFSCKLNITDIAFSPGGDEFVRLIFLGDTKGSVVEVVATGTGKEIKTLAMLDTWLEIVDYSPDGTTIAAAEFTQGIVHLIDAETGTVIRTLSNTLSMPQR